MDKQDKILMAETPLVWSMVVSGKNLKQPRPIKVRTDLWPYFYGFLCRY